MNRSFTLLSLVCFSLLAALLLQPTNTYAQKKSPKTNAKTAAAAKAKNGKSSDAKKPDRKADKNSSAKKADKKSVKDDSRSKTADKRGVKEDKNSRTAAAKTADKKRESAAEKRAALERRQREEVARRAAAEAERRRREEAERRRREAIARQRAFENGLRTETQANIASDDIRGEDLAVRQAAINALGSRAGSVIVMDAQNGQIVAAVNQKWAYGRGWKPCSTIKLVTGAAGVNESVINQYGNVSNRAARYDLTGAIAASDNKYFQNVGDEVGFDKVMAYAREMGLGQTTGINAPGESTGKIPSARGLSRMFSHGDDFEVTPLQLATMVSAIGNGGKLLQPQIARTEREAENLRPKVRNELNISKSTLQSLLPGMMGAVSHGTARRANDPTLNIGGKTGSCIGQGSWVGLFASIAPVASPKYAVVVVTRGSQERGKWAAQVAGQIYQTLAPRIRALQPLLANTPPKINPQIDVAAADLNEEEDEENGEAAEIIAGSSNGGNAANAPAVPQNRNLNEDKKRLVKPTVVIRPVGQTPNTKKGEYKPQNQVVIVPSAPKSGTQTTTIIRVRPRVVQQ